MSDVSDAGPSPEPPKGSLWEDWGYVAAMLAIVVGAIAVLEWTYTSSPLPPGVDPGDWIARSRAYVGLAFPPADAIGSPYLYPPGIFPILGLLERITSDPATTGFAFGGILLGLYGVSTVHLARRFLRLRPVQVLFVGLAVLNGTTLAMLYWGGYPNFLGLVFFNETIVFLYGYLAEGGWKNSFLLFGFASLTYLTHTLTFLLLLATILLTASLLALLGPSPWKRILSWPTLAGLALLGVVAGTYTGVTQALGIPHPSYFYSNPPAFVIDYLGGMFSPLGGQPAFFPEGATAYLPSSLVFGLLALFAVVAFAALVIARRTRPQWVGRRVTIGSAWMIVALVAPAGGYLLHIDTDYTRFVYFLPLPFALLATLYLDQAILPRVRAAEHPATLPAERDAGAARLPGGSRRSASAVANVAVLVVLVVLAATVSVPTMLGNESDFTGSTHDAAFVEAAHWLAANPQAGSVLANTGTVRWVEALTNRGEFDIGPTWLLFEPWQIVNAQETYFALNSRVAVTNSEASLSYTGFNTTVFPQSPMYSAFVEGVNVPILRALPGDLLVNVTTGGLPHQYTADAFQPGAESVPSGNDRTGLVSYNAPSYSITQRSSVAPSGGLAWINYTVTPQNGSTVGSLALTLAQPPPADPLFHTPAIQNLSWDGSTMRWDVTTALGALPGAYPVNSSVAFQPAPASVSFSPSFSPTSTTITFANSVPTRPLVVSIAVSTPGASNPAVQLPHVLDTLGFYSLHDVHFALLPATSGYDQTVTYLEGQFGFRVGFANAGWTVLQR